MHGIDEITGTRIEIPADLIRSPVIVKCGTRPIKFLSEVLDWVDEEVSKVRQINTGSSRTPKAISENLAHVSTYLRAKNKDSYSEIADEATMSQEDETEDEDELVAHSLVQLAPHRQRRSAFTTANKKLLKNRAVDSPEDTISASSSALSSLDYTPHRQRRSAFPTTNKTLLKGRARDSPENTISVPSSALSSLDDTPHHQSRSAFTTPNKTPLKSRAGGSPEDTISVSSSASSISDNKVGIPPRTTEDLLLLSSAKKRPLAYMASPTALAIERAGTTSNKTPLKSRARRSPEDTGSPSSSKNKPLANRVSRAGPAVNRASNGIPDGNIGDDGREGNKPRVGFWYHRKVMKKSNQNSLRRRSNESKADKPSQEPLENP